MGRVRVYSSNAERQAAYRARLAEPRRPDGTGQLTRRLAQLETALADATRRAEAAEAHAARAEHDTACRRDLERDLAIALGRVADLEAPLSPDCTAGSLRTRPPRPVRQGSTAQHAGWPSANRGAARSEGDDWPDSPSLGTGPERFRLAADLRLWRVVDRPPPRGSLTPGD